jgi:hypothetical protein
MHDEYSLRRRGLTVTDEAPLQRLKQGDQRITLSPEFWRLMAHSPAGSNALDAVGLPYDEPRHAP